MLESQCFAGEALDADVCKSQDDNEGTKLILLRAMYYYHAVDDTDDYFIFIHTISRKDLKWLV